MFPGRSDVIRSAVFEPARVLVHARAETPRAAEVQDKQTENGLKPRRNASKDLK